eukprot:2430427-Pleurochrysis_carterae.AAC.1
MLALHLIVTLATVTTRATAYQLKTIFLDACNLQLQLGQAAPDAIPTIESLEIDELPSRLCSLCESPPAITAVFDGAAFQKRFEGFDWSRPISDGDDQGGQAADNLRIRFTTGLRKADDELVEFVRAADVDCTPSTPIVATRAIKALESGKSVVLAVTRLRSLAGRRDRERREAFLKTCGLPRVGDTAHLPSFTPAQRERSIRLLAGLNSLESGGGQVLRYSLIEDPQVLVVSDDRGLRRRLMTLKTPPAVLGRRQLYNWLYSLDSDGITEAGLSDAAETE